MSALDRAREHIADGESLLATRSPSSSSRGLLAATAHFAAASALLAMHAAAPEPEVCDLSIPDEWRAAPGRLAGDA